jgi:hypothetical protein
MVLILIFIENGYQSKSFSIYRSFNLFAYFNHDFFPWYIKKTSMTINDITAILLPQFLFSKKVGSEFIVQNIINNKPKSGVNVNLIISILSLI